MKLKFHLAACVAVAALLVAARPAFAFDNPNIGVQPEAALVEDPSNPGTFYCTTAAGGTGHLGTVFKTNSAGQLTTVVNFTGTSGKYLGATPVAALVFGLDHNLYGTSYYGGTANGGTVFRLTRDGSGEFTVLKTLVNFGSGDPNANGLNPAAALVEDAGNAGTFYTTTAAGGANGAGTIIKIVNGAAKASHDFNFANGADPEAALIKARDGKFYSTTVSGGTQNKGTVFQFDGSTIVTVYSFGSNADDGTAPYGGLIEGRGADTLLYGTTSSGIGTASFGTVFSIPAASSATPTFLYRFDDTFNTAPFAGLTYGPDTKAASFYGTTFSGGADNTGHYDLGTVFQIFLSPAPTLKTLAIFKGANGAYPEAKLIRGLDGFYYGTTSAGGATNNGTLLRFYNAGLATLASFDAPIGGAPSITSPNTATAHQNQSFTYQIVATNNPTTYGATGLPSGLAIDTTTGLIFGTPSQQGNFTVTLSAANSSDTATASLFLAVGPPGGAPVITSASSADGQVGSEFQYGITANNSPKTYGATALPSGLFFDSASGLITGSPKAPGDYQLTISATNDYGADQKTLTIHVVNSPPVITSSTSTSGQQGQPFSYQIVATNHPTSYTASGLPSGLKVNASSGVISGTPTVGGNYSVSLGASNNGGKGTATLSITLNPPSGAPVITSSLNATGQQGFAFQYQITATNAPSSFNATSLPAGLTVDTTTGVISGTPQTSGSYPILVSATNSYGFDRETLKLNIIAPLPTIVGATQATVLRGTPFTYQITANNNPTQYDALVLQAGLTINHSTGLITGSPLVEGKYKFTIAAANAGGTGTAAFTLTVLPPAPIINSSANPTGVVGLNFAYQITTIDPIITPVNPLTGSTVDGAAFVAFGIPPGLKLDETAGVISGVPTTPGSYTVVVEAGSTGGIGAKTIKITIGPAQITSPSIANGVVGQLFGYQITSSFTSFLNSTYSATSLPPGLVLDRSSGLISGIPTKAGNYPVIVTVIPPDGLTASGAFTASPVSATIHIVIADTGSSPPLITTTTTEFSKASYTANGTDTSVSLLVNLSRAANDVNAPIAVKYTTENGTAVAGSDFDAKSGTLTFAPGQAQQTITVTLHPQSSPQPTRTFLVALSSPSAGVLGQAAIATVVIFNPDNSTKLLNISTRGPVEIGDEAMIAGFIVQGSEAKTVVLRGIGPSLTSLGVAGALADPTVTVFDSNGTAIAYNDDYQTNSAADLATLTANTLKPDDVHEAAIVTTLAPGSYTAVLRGKANGVGLIETYDISPTASAKLVNISTRGKVEQDDNGALIAGFIVGAPPNQPGFTQKVIIRAIGPSLQAAGVSTALTDTTLDLYRGSELILSNDNWKSNSTADQQALQALRIAPASDQESALVTNLDPGSYSIVIRGKNNTTGVALAEVYQINQ